MNTLFSLIFSVLLMLVPGMVAAQMHGGGMHGGGAGQQDMTGSGMMHNRDMMSNLMGDMDNMMQSQSLTPEQNRQLMQLRNRMEQMMQQSQGSMSPEMMKQQTQQLQEMQQRLNSIKSKLKDN
jgi:hypothetical protein